MVTHKTVNSFNKIYYIIKFFTKNRGFYYLHKLFKKLSFKEISGKLRNVLK